MWGRKEKNPDKNAEIEANKGEDVSKVGTENWITKNTERKIEKKNGREMERGREVGFK